MKISVSEDMTEEQQQKVNDYFHNEKIWDTDQLRALHDEFRNNHPLHQKYQKEKLSSSVVFKPRLFCETGFLLEKAGFVKFHECRSPRMHEDRLKRHHDNVVSDMHQFWAHPSGVLVVTDSHSNKEGEYGYNSLRAHVQINDGLGFLSMASDRFASSSSSYYNEKGESVALLSFQCNRSTSELLGVLDSIQQDGRLLKFHEQSLNPYITSTFAHHWLPDTHPLSLLQCDVDVIGTDQWNNDVAQFIWNEAQQKIPTFDQIVPGLSAMMQHCFIHQFNHNGKSKSIDGALHQLAKKHGLIQEEDFKRPKNRKIDPSFEELANVSDFVLTRYWSSDDSLIITKWIKSLKHFFVKVTDHSANHAPKFQFNWSDGYFQTLENSITFPDVLIPLASHNHNCALALLDVIEKAPVDVVRKWVTQPNASGKTLIMSVMSAVINNDWGHPQDNPLFIRFSNIIDALKKVDPSDWVVQTPQYSAFGDWMNNQQRYSRSSISFSDVQLMLNQLPPHEKLYTRSIPYKGHNGRIQAPQTWSFDNWKDAIENFVDESRRPEMIKQFMLMELNGVLQQKSTKRKAKI